MCSAYREPRVVLTPKSWTVKHEAYRSDSDIQLESDLLIVSSSLIKGHVLLDHSFHDLNTQLWISTNAFRFGN